MFGLNNHFKNFHNNILLLWGSKDDKLYIDTQKQKNSIFL